MDPTTTLADLFGALACGKVDLAREHAADLADWICNGEPTPERFTLRVTPEKMRAICCTLATRLKGSE